MFELGLKTLSEVEEITWREFQLLRLGYLRTEKEEWKKFRMGAYFSLVATGAINTQKMSIEKFMPLDGANKTPHRLTDAMKEAFVNAQNQYLIEKNGRT